MTALPSAVEVWDKDREHVKWDIVDPWLLRIRDQGMLHVLCQKFEISKSALSNRRRELGAVPLPPGRPHNLNLTAYEKFVVEWCESGKTKAQLARLRGVSPSAVGATLVGAMRKQALASKACATCGGLGLVACGGCGTAAAGHHHVCLDCGGDSTFAATEAAKPKTTDERMKKHAEEAAQRDPNMVQRK